MSERSGARACSDAAGVACEALGVHHPNLVDLCVAAVRWARVETTYDGPVAKHDGHVMRDAGIARPRRFVAVLIGAHDLADRPGT